MKIYIPSHLRNLTLVDNLARLIEEYSRTYTQDSQDLLPSLYSYKLRNDPVMKFLSLCITEADIDTSTQSLEKVLTYLTRLFYSVKGTVKVFEYIKKYLKLNIIGDIIYSFRQKEYINESGETVFYDVRYLRIQLEKLSLSDEGLFTESFRKFLEALIYFRELDLIMDAVDITIESTISNAVGGTSIIYKVFDVEEI